MTNRFTTAQDVKTSEPLPLEEEFAGGAPAQRIWIGNLDTQITEFTMIQILKRFGKIKQFDFLTHKTGPCVGQPRGFCFVSFEKETDAAKAILKLDNLLVRTKRLQVRWAHNQAQTKQDPKDTLKLPLDIDTMTDSKRNTSQKSSDAMIKAIEAKLKDMEKSKAASSSSGESSRSQLHPLLAISKQNAAAAKQATHPYKKRRNRR